MPCRTGQPSPLMSRLRPMLLFILSLCGFSGALATRLLDPLITTIASDFATSPNGAALAVVPGVVQISGVKILG